MLATDLLPVWTGIIGLAGGVIASIITGVVIRREGHDERAHERDMRLWHSRADRYEKVLDYAGRLVGWMEIVHESVAGGSFHQTVKPPLVAWTDEEWFSMMAGLRAFGTDAVLGAFIQLHAAGAVLNGLIGEVRMGSVTPQQVEDACPPIRQAAVELQSQAP